MTTLTIADYLKYANLQMAAEAVYQFNATKPGVLTPGQTAAYNDPDVIKNFLTTGNEHASKFTVAEVSVGDRMAGGAGDDLLMGGGGNDTYRFLAGDGQDRIIDADGANAVSFGAGLTLADLTPSQRTDAEGRWLDLSFAGGERLAIRDGDIGTVDRYEFADGTVLDRAAMLDRLPGRGERRRNSNFRKSRRWRDGERGLRAANNNEWRSAA